MESVAPSQWQIHNLMAQALVGTGDEAGAVAEYKESLQIWPKNGDVISKLAALLEKRGGICWDDGAVSGGGEYPRPS